MVRIKTISVIKAAIIGVLVFALAFNALVQLNNQAEMPADTTIINSPQAAGLMAYYPLDGSTNDASGNAYHGTNYGVTYVTGVTGMAGYFDGADYIMTTLNPSSTMTITCDFKANSFVSNGGLCSPLVANGDVMYGRTGVGVSYSSVIVAYTTGISTYYTYLPYSFSTGLWYNIAVVISQGSDSVQVYINGTSIGTNYPTMDYNWGTGFKIGYDENYAAYFSGAIDEVRIYDHALTQVEIQGLMPNTIPVLSSPLDVTIKEGDDVDVVWTITDSNYYNPYYELYENGVYKYSVNWSPGSSITIELKNYDVGNYNLTIKFFDGLGGKDEDSVNIIVEAASGDDSSDDDSSSDTPFDVAGYSMILIPAISLFVVVGLMWKKKRKA